MWGRLAGMVVLCVIGDGACVLISRGQKKKRKGKEEKRNLTSGSSQARGKMGLSHPPSLLPS
jgi:hypothetical protein